MNSCMQSNRAQTHAHRYIRTFALVAATWMALVVAGPSFAASNTCSSNSKSGGTVTFTLPNEIVVPQNGATSGTLWTSQPVTPVDPPTFSSCGVNVQNGLENLTWGGPNAGDNTLYPTNLSWLAYRILQSGTGLQAFPNQPFPNSVTAANTEISSPFQLQLVITGPVPGGNQTFPTGQLATWDFTLGGGKIFTVDTFSIVGSGSVHIIQPCVVTVDPTTVTLPPVAVSTFTGIASTVGTVSFQINLANCQTGTQLSITLSTVNPQGATSVIKNTASAPLSPATGVGVQLLDATSTPITFDTAIPEGTISGSAVDLPFAARYYQTAPAVTAGAVSATATYTLSYQ